MFCTRFSLLSRLDINVYILVICVIDNHSDLFSFLFPISHTTMPSQKRTWDGIPVLRLTTLPKVIASVQALITFSAGCDDLNEQIEIVQDYIKKLENSRQTRPSSMAVPATSFTSPPTRLAKINNQMKIANGRYLEYCHGYGAIIPSPKFDPGHGMVVAPNFSGITVMGKETDD